MPQRIAEQRMVIGNDKAGGRSGSHLVLAKGCGKTRDGFFGASQANFPLQLSTDGQSHASAQYCLAAKRLIGRRLCAAIGRTRENLRSVHRNGAEGQKSYWERFHGDVTVK
jgi:hypothetical protein